MDSNETLDPRDQTSADEGQENNQKTFEINGEKVTLDELQKGYLRQSDYTKKTQEIAKEKKELEKMSKQVQQAEESDDVKAAEAFLQSKGYLTKAELEEQMQAFSKKQSDEAKLERLMEANPTLRKHETAIRKIAEVDNKALEDIIVEYNFISSDKLQKAKSRDFVGTSKKEEDSKVDIKNMTPEQWEKYKAEKGIGKKGMFSGAKSSTL